MSLALRIAYLGSRKERRGVTLERSVRVNVVSPGPEANPMHERMGLPKEIAAAVLYLSSGKSRLIIETKLVVDVGMITL